MPTRKQIQPGEKVPLRLTASERKLVLEDFLCLEQEYEQIIRNTPAGKPVMMTLDDLEGFGGFVAAEANHCDDTKRQKKLDAVFNKTERLLDTYTDEEPPQTIKIEDARTARLVGEQATEIAEQAAMALAAAEQLRIKTKPIGDFPLDPQDRSVLALLLIRPKLKKKLIEDSTDFTVSEVAGMAMAVAEKLLDAEREHQAALLLVAKPLLDCLRQRTVQAAEDKLPRQSRPKAATGTLFQFKITLLDSDPSIWRRIQVQDCTLDKLHEHIQTAMGWTNSHLHQFEINGDYYGDPELLEDCVDSTTTLVSEIIPKNRKRFAFKYEYDFGDGWQHEVLFEGCPPLEKGMKYPLCLEGERACPPEDVGGVWGYAEFLQAIADPDHDEHESYLEWCGGSFSPDAFDPKQATRDMKKGIPEW